MLNAETPLLAVGRLVIVVNARLKLRNVGRDAGGGNWSASGRVLERDVGEGHIVLIYNAVEDIVLGISEDVAAVIEHAIPCSNRSPTLSKWIPRYAQARSNRQVVLRSKFAAKAGDVAGNACGGIFSC